MLRLHTFSGLSLVGDPERIPGAASQRRPLALLAFLAAGNGRGRRRDVVLAHFWPEKDADRARGVLAQTLYTLRRDTGIRDLVLGTEELSLNPDAIGSDLADFAAALATGDDRRAVELYAGPFLDGVYLPNAAEFERWASTERDRLAREARAALERLASTASKQGDHADAARWWRRVVAMDPHGSQGVRSLMESLAACGETAAALQAAQLHTTLLAHDLELPPDPAVAALADRLRSDPPAPRPIPARATPAMRPDAPAASTLAAPLAHDPASIPAPTTPVSRARWRRWRGAVAGAAAVFVASVVVTAARSRTAGTAAPTAAATVAAIGDIREFGVDSARSAAPAVREMLATSLARIEGYAVISGARMAEVSAALHLDSGFTQRVAREAGARELLEGTLVAESGQWRLDLRRVDLATGMIRHSYTLRGADLAALVDDGTARIAADLGRVAPADGIASVATTSHVAWRFYEEGLRAFYEGDLAGSLRLFDAALAEDSTFGMAAYMAYRASVTSDRPRGRRYLERAATARLPDRDRLLVRVTMLDEHNDPRGFAVAETLAIRYPHEPDGLLRLGGQLTRNGDYPAALDRWRRVLALDSASLRSGRADCVACDALLGLADTYMVMDSAPAAERVARRLLRDRPRSSPGWDLLTQSLAAQGRYAEADSAFRALLAARPDGGSPSLFAAWRRIHAGEPCAAERGLRELVAGEDVGEADEARWDLALALREQGRPAAAIEVLRVLRARAMRDGREGYGERLFYAQALLEAGRAREAADEFLATARHAQSPGTSPQDSARKHAWALTHYADALAAAGDTGALAAFADTVRGAGALSAFGRDHLLHEHVRGLLARARGDREGAIAAFRRAVWSPTKGFTRPQWAAGLLLVDAGRPREAIALAAPALRGAIDASNMYVLRTELHELLGDAWLAAGVGDSAAVHYEKVALAWREGEAPWRARGERALARLTTLPGGRERLSRIARAPRCVAE